MKKYHLWSGMMIVFLCFTSGLIFAQDVPEPIIIRPSVVDCVEGERLPCSVIVNEISDMVGVWRSYIEGGNAMGFMIVNNDGTFGTTLDPRSEATFTGSITFADGLAFIASNDEGSTPAECVTPGVYVMRLIRLGDQPLALTHRPLVKDNCAERAADFSEPMLSYTGTGEELSPLNASDNPLVQALVPCPAQALDDAEAYPCDRIATHPTDFAGIWTQYLVPPLTGAGFIRFREDGTWVFALSPDETADVATSFDDGTVKFDQALITFTESGGCPPANYYMRVIQWGHQPVALSFTALNDENCGVRLSAWTDPMLWVKGL